MALVRSFASKTIAKPTAHDIVEAECSAFSVGSKRFVQIDTYPRGKGPGTAGVKQCLQFDFEGASALFAILKREFHFS